MRKKVTANKVFLYGVLTLFANYIASWLGLLIPRMLFGGLATASVTVINTVGIVTVFPLTLFFAWGVIYLVFFRRQFSNFYEPSEYSNLWLKKAVFLTLPGEIFRFFACLITLGFSDSTGMFAAIPTYLFEMTYLKWFDRAYEVRQMGEYVFADFLGYTICYLVYFLIHLLGIFLISKIVWKKAKEEHDDLIRPETKVKYY